MGEASRVENPVEDDAVDSSSKEERIQCREVPVFQWKDPVEDDSVSEDLLKENKIK